MVMLETSVYGNLVTTSPSSRWEGLMNFSIADDGDHLLPPIRTLHQHTQSVGATGGVYKGQGRNQRRLFQLEGATVEPLRFRRFPSTSREATLNPASFNSPSHSDFL
jgi:hypothetical protein